MPPSTEEIVLITDRVEDIVKRAESKAGSVVFAKHHVCSDDQRAADPTVRQDMLALEFISPYLKEYRHMEETLLHTSLQAL